MNTFGMMMDKYMEEVEARMAKLESITLEMESGSGGSVQKIWMTKMELAKYLGVCYKTLAKYMKENPSFPSSNIGGTIRYNANRVDEWIEVRDEMDKMKKRKRAS